MADLEFQRTILKKIPRALPPDGDKVRAFLSALPECMGNPQLIETMVSVYVHSPRPVPLPPDPMQIGYTPEQNQAAVEARVRYELVQDHEPLQGGIGQVFKVKDKGLQREVAFKELKPGKRDDRRAREAFAREAEICSGLVHPHIVPILDFVGGASPNAFYTMPFLEAGTLSDAVHTYHARQRNGAAGVLELRELLQYFVAVCHAVAYAHGKGILHRDLKGKNIVLGKNAEVFVIDWGLATTKQLASAKSHGDDVSESANKAGTPAYMAPEQMDGKGTAIDERTDVYGLGALLYEILTDQPPFPVPVTTAMSPEQREQLRVVHAQTVATSAPHRPTELCATTPLPLEAIVLKAIAKVKDDRYASADELARDIQNWLADEPVQAWPEPWTTRTSRWARRNKVLVSGLVACFCAAVPLLAMLYLSSVRAQKKIEDALLTAQTNEKRADRLASEAQQSEFKAKLSAADRAAKKGLELCEKKQVAQGLAWLARALEETPAEAQEMDRYLRTNIVAWKHQLFEALVLKQGRNRGQVLGLSPNGRFAFVRMERRLQLWDLRDEISVVDNLDQTLPTDMPYPFGLGLAMQFIGGGGQPEAVYSALASYLAFAPLETITGASFSRDNKSLVTVGASGSVCIWDCLAGTHQQGRFPHPSPEKFRMVHRQPYLYDYVQILATCGFSAQTGMLPAMSPPIMWLPTTPWLCDIDVEANSAVTASNHVLRFWRLPQGKESLPPISFPGIVHAAVFSPDRTKLAVSYDPNHVMILNGSNPRVALGSFVGPRWVKGSRFNTMNGNCQGSRYGYLRNMLFSPDSKTLVVLWENEDKQIHTVQAIDSFNGKQRTEEMTFAGHLTRLEFVTDHELILGTRFGDLRWDLRGLPPLGALNAMEPKSVASVGPIRLQIAPNGKSYLLWNNEFFRVQAAGSVTNQKPGQWIRYRKPTPEEFAPPADFYRWYYGEALLREASLPPISPTVSMYATIWRGSARASLPGMPLMAPFSHVQLTPHAVIAMDDTRMQIWNPITGKCFDKPFQHALDSFYAEGERLITVCALPGDLLQVDVWDIAGKRRKGEPFEVKNDLLCWTYCPEKDWFVAAHRDGSIQFWQLDHAGVFIKTKERKNSKSISDLCMFTSEPLMIVQSDEQAVIWNMEDGSQKTIELPMKVLSIDPRTQRLLGVVPASMHEIAARDFFAPGYRIPADSGQVVDAKTGRPCSPSLIHDGDSVNHCYISANGRLICTKGMRSTRLWDSQKYGPIGPELRLVIEKDFQLDSMFKLPDEFDDVIVGRGLRAHFFMLDGKVHHPFPELWFGESWQRLADTLGSSEDIARGCRLLTGTRLESNDVLRLLSGREYYELIHVSIEKGQYAFWRDRCPAAWQQGQIGPVPFGIMPPVHDFILPDYSELQSKIK